jgi:hypothetical protein
MTDTRMLVGSLSNDLFRVASLAQRGSNKAASRFLQEAQKWSADLQNRDVPTYILKLSQDVSSRSVDDISIDSAEQYLMYGVLLQNYALHSR